MKTATFRGVRYKLVLEKVDGYVELPGEDLPRELYLDPHQAPSKFLWSAVHEALHAALKTSDERVIEPAARDIAWFLWRLGYRRERAPR